MCGIVGYYSRAHSEMLASCLKAATGSLVHRGPDAGGVFSDVAAGIGLGHRRLSVIDLTAAGAQPMSALNGSLRIVYNGEAYNYRSIRAELIDLGHEFTSGSDTEVVLKGYAQWGREVVHRLAGMFAMAIWDGRSRELTLIRDRVGIKPLYYHIDGETLLFASELKGLMAFPVFQRNVERDAIGKLLHYQYIPGPQTIFQKTFKLMPGEMAIFDGKKLRQRTYWKLSESRPGGFTGTFAQAVDRLDGMLTQTVSEHLVSDAPLGGLLSGGIDSSLVVALMQKNRLRTHPGSPVKTFSIGFNDPAFDESPWAEKIARHLRTDHTTLRVSASEAIDVVALLPMIYDEPFADASAIPTTIVSRLARSRVTVALSGDGGDEQFCGYVRYGSTRNLADLLEKVPFSIKKGLAGALSRLSPDGVLGLYRPIRPFLPRALRVENFKDKWRKMMRMVTQTSLESLYRMTVCLWTRDEIEKVSGLALLPGIFEQSFSNTNGWPVLSRLMQVDQCTYLPDAMLTKVDRASMSVGLELRVPLLDHRVMALASSFPEEFKYRRGRGKYVLQKVLSRYIPERWIHRPKMGFGVPLSRWLQNELRPMVSDFLSPDRIRREGFFDPSIVGNIVREHLSGQCDHHFRIWPLLMWQMWRQTWL